MDGSEQAGEVGLEEASSDDAGPVQRNLVVVKAVQKFAVDQTSSVVKAWSRKWLLSVTSRSKLQGRAKGDRD